MKKYLWASFILMLTVFISGSGAAADEIWLKNGDRLSGKIVRLEASSLISHRDHSLGQWLLGNLDDEIAGDSALASEHHASRDFVPTQQRGPLCARLAFQYGHFAAPA